MTVLILAILVSAGFRPAVGAEPPKRLIREIYVPFADLNVLLENQPRRVMLSRQEYEDLFRKAKQHAKSEGRVPQAVVLAAADYQAQAEEERVRWQGRITLDVLDDGLHAVPLDLSGIGVRSAKLGDKAASLGCGADGRPVLFVSGKGRHELALEMVSPLEATAAQQVLSFRLPQPPAARFRLTVPGDVEIKSGVSVVSRTVEETNPTARVTHFEILPKPGDTTLLMTLNHRLKRQERAVVARSVVVDEVTGAYERLHATVSLSILHQAVDRFRFVVPEGFEVTEVASPRLARWAIDKEPSRRVLDVQLREPTVETVVLNLSALSSAAADPLKAAPAGPVSDPAPVGRISNPSLSAAARRLAKWAFPRLEPLDVVGQVAVVGVLVEDRLNAESLQSKGLIPIDTAVLAQAMPATAVKSEPGDAVLRSVAAYYAPQPDYQLTARFVSPPAEVKVETNVLFVLGERGQQARGGFLVSPTAERLFRFDFSVPAGWHVTRVATPEGKPLGYERLAAAGEAGRIRVQLPQGVTPGQECRVHFEAMSAPAGWLADWQSAKAAFPVFAVDGATRDVGAIAVEAQDDLLVRPESLQRLTPLDEEGKRRYSLGGVPTSLAYRYERVADQALYAATFAVERTHARLTSRSFTFVRVEPDALAVRHELIYTVEEAKTRRLSLSLPEESPAALAIQALGGAKVKEFDRVKADNGWRWNILLEQPAQGTIKLAVDYQQPLPVEKAGTFSAPWVRAEGVAHQSGLMAIEGNAELDVQVNTEARRVDVGELAVAAYTPGRRLLGAYGYVGRPPAVNVNVTRQPASGLEPAVVEKAELKTVVSAEGISQTSATFALRTKVPYLEIVLPEDSELWSVFVDGKPVKPQKEDRRLLVSLPATSAAAARSLRVWYQTPVGSAGMLGHLDLPAPKLTLRSQREGQGEEVPMADLVWRLALPSGYEVVRNRGTVAAELARSEPAALTALAAAFYLAAWRGNQLSAPLGKQPETTLRTPYYMTDSETTESSKSTPGGPPMAPAGAPPHRIHGFRDNVQLPMQPTPAASDEDKSELSPAPADGPPAKKEQAGQSADPFGVTAQPKSEPQAEQRETSRPQADKPAPPATLTPPRPTVPPQSSSPATPSTPPPPETGKDLAAAEQLRRAQCANNLKGLSSLWIEDSESAGGTTVTFNSLGEDPRLVVTVANRPRWETLGWAMALAVALTGIAFTGRSAWSKTRWILLVVAVGTLVPMIPGMDEWILPMNFAVYAALLLVPYYLLIGFVRLAVRTVARLAGTGIRRFARRTAEASAIGLVFVWSASAVLGGEPPPPKDGQMVLQVVETPEPVQVPDDAVLLPYDPDSKTGIQDAGNLLVPYAKYVELWNLAYPDKKLEAKAPPAPFSLAGAAYTTVLDAGEYLVVTGRLEIDVFADDYIRVPLGLGGGVLARAELDGKPARLELVQAAAPAANPPASAQQQQPKQSIPQAANAAPNSPANPAGPSPADPARSLILLHVAGKERHALEVTVRMKLERRGGWRVVEGVLPSAPATSFSILVPQPATEVRLSQVADRRAYDTQSPGQRIETALSPAGAIGIQWRPKVAEGQVDRSLTAQSAAVLDVQEDGLRLFWQTALEFRRSQREAFRVDLPVEYLVEKVEGANVRGWEVRKEAGRQAVEITLLKPAKDSEQFALRLWRPGMVGQGDLAVFDVPAVNVADAAMQSGTFTIRRSPLLDVRTLGRNGLTRAELSSSRSAPAAGAGTEDSPLGIRPYEAYQFAATPFALRLSAVPVAGRTAADLQTVLRVSEYDLDLDSRVMLTVRDRPIHRVEISLPESFRPGEVTGPGETQWALTREAGRALLTVYLAAGKQGEVPVLVRGKLPAPADTLQIPLPSLEVRGVERQEGTLAVQTDPGVDVSLANPKGCEAVQREQVRGWLKAEQYAATPLAVRCREANYSGTLRLVPRRPIINCQRVLSNIRVTPRAIEETIFFDFHMPEAGLRELAFVLPESMKDCRLRVPMLRQKTLTPVDKQPLVRVQLELQGEVRGNLRVVVENDRPLAAGSYAAPIPQLAMGGLRPFEQYVVIQNAGRDEIVVEHADGLEAIDPQQPQWRTLSELSSSNITKAYAVQTDAASPRLTFEARSRTALVTTGARIGLAETSLVLDASGGYRAQQTYKVDNLTEQFLEIELPEEARLWTAHVAGEPVKPTAIPAAKNPRQLRIPLVKTAAGDQDFAVVLKYGGRLPRLKILSQVRFPLVRTLNIAVEQSQVRLHLPESHRWFDFGGTMRRADSEQDMAAGEVAYETKKVQRLLATFNSGDEFAKMRAENNLKILVDNSRSSAVPFGGRQQEFADNATAIREAEQAIQQPANQPATPPSGEDDNRTRLNALFDSQNPMQARNSLANLGSNWDASTVQREKSKGEKGEASVRFNRQWLNKSQLENTATPDPLATNEDRRSSFSVQKPRYQAKSSMPQADGTFRGPGVGGKGDSAGLGDGEKRLGVGTKSNRPQEDDVRQLYQQQLDLQRNQEQGQSTPARGDSSVRFSESGGRGERTAVGSGNKPQVVMEGVDYSAPSDEKGGGQAAADAGPKPVAPTRPAGLASVDVTLPRRGEVFFFTTPGGDLELTGRAASNAMLFGWARAAIAVVALLLVLGIAAAVRRGAFRWLTGRAGSNVLIVAGLLLMLLCPLALGLFLLGLLALGSGVACTLRRINEAGSRA